ncbi:hypothetical protein DCAR_0830425 [Daucus carota subsp. sativus]|uniref:Uncharacterized protein n=1 Tax=Daucus carota subsp. sativus TaxID=79200 RepID=A0AAF0XMU6_DAUCS|nr:hypothetical protein DCAR_0830425 [Daucus carota subsp. sativus]
MAGHAFCENKASFLKPAEYKIGILFTSGNFSFMFSSHLLLGLLHSRINSVLFLLVWRSRASSEVRKTREGGEIIAMDIERLVLSEENRLAFVNIFAAEAKEYVEKNRDDCCGEKKAIFHVLNYCVIDLTYIWCI